MGGAVVLVSSVPVGGDTVVVPVLVVESVPLLTVAVGLVDEDAGLVVDELEVPPSLSPSESVEPSSERLGAQAVKIESDRARRKNAWGLDTMEDLRPRASHTCYGKPTRPSQLCSRRQPLQTERFPRSLIGCSLPRPTPKKSSGPGVPTTAWHAFDVSEMP